MDIQELFEKIKNDNRNAVGELHRKLRVHMGLDGVYTHIYRKFHVQQADREDINQDIVLLIWQKIIEGKCDEMRDWVEMKRYSSNICYKKCLELTNGQFLVQLDGIVNIGGITIDLDEEINIFTGLTDEIEKVLDEIFDMFTPKCKLIWEIIRRYPDRMKDNEFILKKLKKKELERKKLTVPSRDYIAQNKSSCLKKVQKEMKDSSRLSEWQEKLQDFIDYIGDN